MVSSERYFRDRFEGRVFAVDEASGSLKVSPSTVYSIVKKMTSSGQMTKLASGKYRFGRAGKIKPSEEIDRLRRFLLEKETRKFKFTCLSVLEPFLHHVPFVRIYHLFVEKGSGEDVIKNLGEREKSAAKRRKKTEGVFIAPELNSRETELVVNQAGAQKILMVKERNYFRYSNEGLASPESAFVDLFFEITREKMPYLETDLDEMMKTMAQKNLINFSALMNYAHDRKIDPEIARSLKKMSEEIEIPKEF